MRSIFHWTNQVDVVDKSNRVQRTVEFNTVIGMFHITWTVNPHEMQRPYKFEVRLNGMFLSKHGAWEDAERAVMNNLVQVANGLTSMISHASSTSPRYDQPDISGPSMAVSRDYRGKVKIICRAHVAYDWKGDMVGVANVNGGLMAEVEVEDVTGRKRYLIEFDRINKVG